MRVLMVTPSYFPIVGGSENVVRILSTMLNKNGIHTDILTYNMNKKWDPIWRYETGGEGLFQVFKVPAVNPDSIFRVNPFKLIKVCVVPKPGFAKRFKDYDIIHFQGDAEISLLLFSFFVQKPKLITSHANRASLPRLNRLFKMVFPRLADLYIAHELELLSDLGVPRSKSLVFQSFTGVDVVTFRPDEKARIDNLILFVGRIAEEKGLHVLLEALPSVTSQTQLVIIGPKWDLEYAEACMNRIRQINSGGVHTVKYLGAMAEKGLIPWYQKATVLVRPDLAGLSGGLTSLEAMACATPVIGTGNHVVQNGVNGIVIPPNNAKELAKALNELLENKELRKRYGKEGRKMVERDFSWETIAKDLAKVYEAMLSNYRARYTHGLSRGLKDTAKCTSE